MTMYITTICEKYVNEKIKLYLYAETISNMGFTWGEQGSWETRIGGSVYKVYIVSYFLNFESYVFTASSKIVKIKECKRIK